LAGAALVLQRARGCSKLEWWLDPLMLCLSLLDPGGSNEAAPTSG
jgi:hypothetical protein